MQTRINHYIQIGDWWYNQWIEKPYSGIMLERYVNFNEVVWC